MSHRSSPWLSICLSVTLLTGPSPAAPPPGPTPSDGFAEADGLAFEHPSPAQDAAMWEAIQRNRAQLHRAGVLAPPDTALAITYGFPLRLAPGLPDAAGFRVSAFADHQAAGGQVLDYAGGARTYDGHHGTDYALWPFAWNKLDAGEVQVIAAAAGILVAKSDDNPADHNCGPASSGNWNYVALEHADGRMTIYGHLRYHSVTGKAIGQPVALGEVLGTAASSGNSSGPHLHFEVRAASFAPEWIDPYSGPHSQAESLWTSQRPYRDSAINRLATHAAPPATPNACLPTQTNLQDGFTTPAAIYLYAYYRDYQGALPTQLSLYRPDGALAQAWAYAPGNDAFYSAWSQGWIINLAAGEPAGTWRFEAVYNGQTHQTFFNLNAPPAITVASPNGGEQLGRSVPVPITWVDNLGGEVNLTLYRNGGLVATLAANTPSDGQFTWTPDAALPLGAGYSVRVTSVTGPAVYDASNATFSLVTAPLVARDDYALTAVNQPVTVAVLANDGPVADPMTVTALGAPASGAAGVVNGQVVYTPTMNALETVAFTYTVQAGGAQAAATVTVLVAAEVFRLFLPSLRR